MLQSLSPILPVAMSAKHGIVSDASETKYTELEGLWPYSVITVAWSEAMLIAKRAQYTDKVNQHEKKIQEQGYSGDSIDPPLSTSDARPPSPAQTIVEGENSLSAMQKASKASCEETYTASVDEPSASSRTGSQKAEAVMQQMLAIIVALTKRIAKVEDIVVEQRDQIQTLQSLIDKDGNVLDSGMQSIQREVAELQGWTSSVEGEIEVLKYGPLGARWVNGASQLVDEDEFM